MANRTFNRQPHSVNIGRTNDGFFNHVQFKGICDNKNDVTIDPQSFADANNVYVDDNDLLVSRPPLKIYDGDGYIIDQWQFGEYTLRCHRLLTDNDGNRVDDTTDWTIADTEPGLEGYTNNLFFVFLLRCISHDTVQGPNIYGQLAWKIPVSTVGFDFIPKITPVQIEDKIFIWFGGLDFVCFNTAGVLMSDGNTYPFFESAIKYMYFPIHTLVINGIESDLETKNFLTETYIKRHQLSAVSSVNFGKLVDKRLTVRLNGPMTQNTSKRMYDIISQEHQDKMLVYPYSPVGGNYYIDIAQTVRATVVLRYHKALHTIEISLDGKYFRPLPNVDEIIGNPMLTRDGLWVVAFTHRGLAKCKIVAQETEDFLEPERVLTWTVDPYLKRILMNGFPGFVDTLDNSFVPTGYFETIDNFAYVFSGPSIYSDVTGNIPYLYSEWLAGSNDVVWGYESLITMKDNKIAPLLISDDIKVHFKYVTPTVDRPELGACVTLLTKGLAGFNDAGTLVRGEDCFITFFFKQIVDNIGRTLKNDDLIFVADVMANPRAENIRGNQGFLYKLNASASNPVVNETSLYGNDYILFLPVPLDTSITDNFDAKKDYRVNECCTFGSTVRRCIRTYVRPTDGNFPTPDDKNYWQNTQMPSGVPFNYSNSKGTYTTRLSWRAYVLVTGGYRYRITRMDGGLGLIRPLDRIRLTSIDMPVVYQTSELDALVGPFPKAPTDQTEGTVAWTNFGGSWTVPKVGNQESVTGNAVLIGLSQTAEVAKSLTFSHVGLRAMIPTDTGETLEFIGKRYGTLCRQMDITVNSPKVEAESILYDFTIAISMQSETATGLKTNIDIISTVQIDYLLLGEKNTDGTNKDFLTDSSNFLTGLNATHFRIMPNTSNVLTDSYLWVDESAVALPRNGELAPLITDKQRALASNDILYLGLTENIGYQGNIYKLTSDGVNLAAGPLESGDVVSFMQGALTEQDYLAPLIVNDNGTIKYISNRFRVSKLGIDSTGKFVQVEGPIRRQDLIRLTSYEKNIVLPVGHPGNPTNATLTISPRTYPASPAGWQLGDDWPDSFPTAQPVIPNSNGTIRIWAPGDPLPTGLIQMYGAANLIKQIRPISLDANGVWYNIDGELWTSQLSTENTLELDEYINCEYRNIVDEDGNLVGISRVVDMRNDVPDFSATLNEHFISFRTRQEGYNLLQITSTRRDEDKLFTEKGTDFLLYLPERNEQKFANRITNLHPLAETSMGVFTDTEVWYITPVELNSTIAYTKPIKSKIPVGCRFGSDVITALDGQVIMLTTPRGLAALAPQDFVATTERTLTYLSDPIQEKYHKFYNTTVMSSALAPSEFDIGYRPMIKIHTYKYWVLLHRYMDREVLVFDTRNGTWWTWTTQYPIQRIHVGSRLHFILQLDYSPMVPGGISVPPVKAPIMGVQFIWTDREVDLTYDEDEPFPTLGPTPIANIGYYDDTVKGVLNGVSELVYENRFVSDRRVLYYADPIIDWHFVSQKLNFQEINNYKSIKGINMSAKGNAPVVVKLSTKVYRDYTHPEQAESMEIEVNDLRTFVKRLNLMRVLSFQYKLENEQISSTKEHHQLKLNSLMVKYELKERVR